MLLSCNFTQQSSVTASTICSALQRRSEEKSSSKCHCTFTKPNMFWESGCPFSIYSQGNGPSFGNHKTTRSLAFWALRRTWIVSVVFFSCLPFAGSLIGDAIAVVAPHLIESENKKKLCKGGGSQVYIDSG